MKTLAGIFWTVVLWALGGLGLALAVWMISAFTVFPIYYGMTQPVYHYKTSLDELVYNGLIFLTFWGTLISGFIGLLYKLSLISQGTKPRCLKCNSSEIKIEKTETKNYETTETRTQSIRHYNKVDEITGHSEIDYEVPVTRTYIKKHMICNDCGNKWIE